MRLQTALFAILLASGGAVLAQTHDDKAGVKDLTAGGAPMLKVRETRFDFLDVDGDGTLTREEIGDDHPELSSQFASLDADSDGRLSRNEFVESHRDRID